VPPFVFLLIVLIATVVPGAVDAASLRERLTPDVLAVVMPGAERLGAEEGAPPAIPVYKGERIVAYLFSTLDVVRASGYSSTPFDVIAGVDLEGRITGAKVVFHVEPFVLNDPIRAPQLDHYLAQQAGETIRGGTVPALHPDFVAGATVSARAMRGAVLDAARLVLRARMPVPVVLQPTLNREQYRRMSWEQLLAEGAVVRRRVTTSEGNTELYAALFTPAAIGANLIGLNRHNETMRRFPSGTQLIAVASSGPYDFLGDDYVRAAKGYRFDRIRVVQGDRTHTFVSGDFLRLDTRATEGFLSQQYAGMFALPPTFDPLKEWRLELLTRGTDGKEIAFPLPYRLPATHILIPEPEVVPVWVEAWRDARGNIAILAAMLVVLTVAFVFQDFLARSRRLHRVFRASFLAFTLVWLGWIAGGQLSILNLMSWLAGVTRGFDANVYLIEPLIVIVAIYTVFSLVLIGRGVFCGWLCPFGALQELLALAARALRVPQWTPSAALEGRLRIGKYAAAAVLLVLAMISVETAGTAAEIEPFKTAITAKFTRTWPYLLYAIAIFGIGLFVERAFCRYLCPLGGVLAALDRFHLLDRLRRRPECGSPCRLCEAACPVNAIAKSGEIVTAECFQCLDCQVEYFDDSAARRWCRRANWRPIMFSAHPTRRRAIRIVAAAAGLPLLAAAVRATVPKERFFHWQGEVLGAAAELTLWHWDEALARRAILKVRAEIERHERIFSLYRDDSEIARLNRDGVLPDPSPELVALVEESQRLGALSDGAFDITVQPLWRLYEEHFWRGHPVTNVGESAFEIARKLVDYRRIEAHAARIRFLRAGMAITLNGIAQGAITDRVADMLRHDGFEQAMVDLGEMRALGNHPEGRPWRLGIKDARQNTEIARTVDLADAALAVSGGYGTTFEPSGRFHHIFDPATGASAHAVADVAVIAPRAMVADALATAICVMGEERGSKLLAHYPGAQALVTRASLPAVTL
jgi:NosR/NirI family nitrous oxide reductase transcriptional regulator